MNFFIDSSKNLVVSWDYFFRDLKNSTFFNSVLKTSDYYEILKAILLSYFEDEEITLCDDLDSFPLKRKKLKQKQIANIQKIFTNYQKNLKQSQTGS